jgi:hypothetical protein
MKLAPARSSVKSALTIVPELLRTGERTATLAGCVPKNRSWGIDTDLGLLVGEAAALRFWNLKEGRPTKALEESGGMDKFAAALDGSWVCAFDEKGVYTWSPTGDSMERDPVLCWALNRKTVVTGCRAFPNRDRARVAVVLEESKDGEEPVTWLKVFNVKSREWEAALAGRFDAQRGLAVAASCVALIDQDGNLWRLQIDAKRREEMNKLTSDEREEFKRIMNDFNSEWLENTFDSATSRKLSHVVSSVHALPMQVLKLIQWFDGPGQDYIRPFLKVAFTNGNEQLKAFIREYCKQRDIEEL